MSTPNSEALDRLVEFLREDLRARWEAGEYVRVEEYFERHPDLRRHEEYSLELVYAELLLRQGHGESPTPNGFQERFPDLFSRLVEQVGFHRALEQDSGSFTSWYGLPQPDDVDFVGTERFEVRRKLGQGSLGVVYEVYDREWRQAVALKVLRGNRPGDIYRLKREFRTLADIAHPNFVTLHELLQDGDHWFFTMALINGVDFVRYVRQGDAAFREAQHGIGHAPLNVEGFDRLRVTTSQLVRALSELHRIGKIHRDVKPANVLVEPDGRVILLDFGLVADSPSHASSGGPSQSFGGTLPFAAPEQLRGETEVATDWYSVGAMLFHTLTGQFPPNLFLRDWFSQADSTDPRQVISSIPNDLAELCRDLLSPDPVRRPSVIEILSRLHDDAATSIKSPVNDGCFVGRQSELATLHQHLQAALSGTGSVIHLHGPSGMGKSTLLRRFLTEIEPNNQMLVLSGRCYEKESLPFKAVDAAVDGLARFLRATPADVRASWTPEDAALLLQTFPVLRAVREWADQSLQPSALPVRQRQRTFLAFRELILRLAATRPIVLAIDDLQWGDVDSAQLLTELCSPTIPPRLLIVYAYRDENWDIQAIQKLRAIRGGFADVDLTPLSLAEASELVRSHTSRVDAAKIAREAGGSPFLIDAFVQHALAAAGSSVWSADEAIQARVEALSPVARSMLEFIAVAGRPLPQSMVEETAEQKTRNPYWWDTLKAAKLVRSSVQADETSVETFHDRIREVVSNNLPPDRFRQCHRRLADVLVGWHGDADDIATHYQQAGDLSEAAPFALLAGDAAAAVLAFDRAVTHYRNALEWGDWQGDDEANLRIKLARALANAGRGPESAEQYLLVADQLAAPDDVEYRRYAAEQLLQSGHIEQGMEQMNRAMAGAGVKVSNTSSANRVMLSLLAERLRLRLRRMQFDVHREEDIPIDVLRELDTTWSASQAYIIVDTVRGAVVLTRNLRRALDAGEPRRLARALAAEVMVESLPGKNLSRVKETLALAKQVAMASDSKHSQSLVDLFAAYAMIMFGKWQQAYDLATSSLVELEEACTGVAWEIATAHCARFGSAYYIGKAPSLVDSGPRIVNELHDRGDVYGASLLAARMMMGWLAHDKPSEGVRQLRDAMQRWTAEGFYLQHYFELDVMTWHDCYVGIPELAWKRLREHWRTLVSSKRFYTKVCRIECYISRGTSALATAIDDGSCAALQDAIWCVNRLTRERSDWADSHATLLRACIASSQGLPYEAIGLLRTAKEQFESIGVKFHAKIASLALGYALGGDEGESLASDSIAWFDANEYKDPIRLAATHAPGFLRFS